MSRVPAPDQAVRTEFMRLEAPIPPPPQIKVWTLWAYALWSGVRVFVETGTYFGDTTAALAQVCPTVYSIELAPDLARRARERFADKPGIHIVEGDSATQLASLLEEVHEPALFWLDGHFSGGPTAISTAAPVPVFEELRAIFEHPVRDHVVLIDDIRHFCGERGYPTVDELRAFVQGYRPDWVFDIAADSARLHGRNRPFPKPT